MHANREPVLPSQFLDALRRRWPLIPLVGLLMAALAFGIARTLPPQYTASGSIAVDTQPFIIPELQGAVGSDVASDPMPAVRTEVQVLRSAPILLAVIDRLGLMRNSLLNPALRPHSTLQRLRESLVMPSGMSVAATGADPAEDPARARILQGMQKHLGVWHDNRSLLINLNFTSADPALSAAVVNAVIRCYIESRVDTRGSANKEANAALMQRLAQVREEVEALERRLQDTRAQHQLVQIRAGSVGQLKLEELTAALARASAERARTEADWQRAVAASRNGVLPLDLANVLGSNTITRLREQEAEVLRRATEASSRLGRNHPGYQTAQQELAAVRAQIADEARRIANSLNQHALSARESEAAAARQLEAAREAASRTAVVQAEIDSLEREAEARRHLYQTLLERLEQTAAQPTNTPQISGARVVNLASPPLQPASPRPVMAGGLGLLGGMAFGALLAFVKPVGGAGFGSAEELARDTGLAGIAVPREKRCRGNELPDMVAASPSGETAEALRVLRSQLRFAARGAAPRCIVFAGAVLGDGASSLAAAFARLAALDGARVLLVEGDLKHPSLARMLHAGEGATLSAVLDGRVAWRDAVHRDSAAPLDLLVAAAPLPGAHAVIEGTRLPALLAEMRKEYNMVVVDAPPATADSSAIALSRAADMLILVIKARRTGRDAVWDALTRLAGARGGGRVVAVLNKAGRTPSGQRTDAGGGLGGWV